MCGISGIYRFKEGGVNPAQIKRFNNSLAHRGPDGDGIVILDEGALALGHRRLSILDLSKNGAQPMSYLNNRYTITYNGEIFNFLELKSELINGGYSFGSNSDTEVILAAYDAWGIGCFDRFNGMWALAIWDSHTKQLLLSRDRYGIKPLYYNYDRGYGFYFASETNAFDELDGFQKRIDDVNFQIALDDPYLLQGQDLTLFKGIKSLGAGEAIIVSMGSIDIKVWYTLDDESIDRSLRSEEVIEQFYELFKSSISLRLRSDVSIATALSGGLDSSSVFGVVNRLSKDTSGLHRLPQDFQKAYVGVFPGSHLDERKYAEEVINSFDAPHQFVDISGRAIPDKIKSTTEHSDSIANTPIISISSIYGEMAENGHRISMDGHGADELIFGYRGSIFDLYDSARNRGDAQLMSKYSEVLVNLSLKEKQADLRQRLDREMEETVSWQMQLKRRIKSTFADRKELYPALSKSAVKPFNKQLLSKGIETQIRFWHFSRYTLPSLLRDFDKASMMSSVEIRMPFMDYRLVEFCHRLQIEHCVNNGFTKQVLREAMKSLIPESTRLRTHKVGIQSPLSQWFANDLAEMLADITKSKSFFESTRFDGKTIAKLVDESRDNGWSNANASFVWKYLNAYFIESKYNA